MSFIVIANARICAARSSQCLHAVVRGLRKVVDEFPERLLIGEIYLPLDRLVAYYGSDLKETHLPFNFSLLETPWHAREIAKLIDSYEAGLPEGGWPNWVLGNHDRPRIATRGRLCVDTSGRGHAAADITWHSYHLLRRRDRTSAGADPAGIAFAHPLQKRCPLGSILGRDAACLRTPMQWSINP